MSSGITPIVATIASLSACASCSVVANYAMMAERPKLNDPSSMILFLTLSDLALSLVAMLSMRGIDKSVLEGSEYHMCETKVILLIYFTFSSFLWTAAMSHSSYLTVKNLFTAWGQRSGSSTIRDDKALISYSTRYHVVCWGTPVIFCLIFAHEGMGVVGGFGGRICWFIISSTWSKVAAVMT
jgi:hypothetical protein